MNDFRLRFCVDDYGNRLKCEIAPKLKRLLYCLLNLFFTDWSKHNLLKTLKFNCQKTFVINKSVAEFEFVDYPATY